jgi:streptogramin lyase
MYYTQTTGNQVSLFDYENHTFKNFDVPTPLSGPLGCRTSTDGALWFTEFFANKIGRLNATSGVITEYGLPPLAFGPAVMRVEDGPYMYFTALVGNGIGRINKETGESEVFTYPIPLATPTENTKDSKGNVWFSTLLSNTLQYFTPSTEKFTTIQLPGTLPLLPVPPVVDVPVNYGPGNNIWFAQFLTNRVGKYSLD